MIKTTTAVISALLAAGCVSAPADKTPRTVSGQLNSCMLGEIYGRQEAGKLPWRFTGSPIFSTMTDRI